MRQAGVARMVLRLFLHLPRLTILTGKKKVHTHMIHNTPEWRMSKRRWVEEELMALDRRLMKSNGQDGIEVEVLMCFV